MKRVYTCDKNAPRLGKGDFSTQVITNDLWKRFREKYPEFSEIKDNDLNKRWLEIAETIREESLTNPLGVKLGSYMGELKYQYVPNGFRANDKETSKEVGEKVNHLNITTKGKVAKIKWERRWASRFNKMLQFFAFKRSYLFSEKVKDVNLDNVRTARITTGGKNNPWRSVK